MTRLLGITIGLLLLPNAVAAQPAEDDLYGAGIFRAILALKGLEQVHQNQLENYYDQTVLVIYRSMPTDNRQLTSLAGHSRRLIKDGGAVLIATNRKQDLSAFFSEQPGTVKIDGRSVWDYSPGNGYDDTFDLPFMRFVERFTLNDPELKQLADLKRVATNRPSFMELRRRSEWNPVGFFSSRATIADRKEAPGPVMSFREVGPGIAVVIADYGALSNQGLVGISGLSASTDNLAFANTLANYLAQGPNRSRRRSKCLFWESDRFAENFDAGMLTPPTPDIRPSWPAIQKSIAESAEKKIDDLQNKDFPTRNLFDVVSYRELMRKLSAIAAIVAVLWMLRRVRLSRSEREPSAAKSKMTGESAVEAMLTSKNMYFAARARLRQQFAAWLTSTPQAPPAVAVDGSWFYRKRMEKLVRRLWEIAYGLKPVRIGKNRWNELEATVRNLDDSVRNGRLRFAPAEPLS